MKSFLFCPPGLTLTGEQADFYTQTAPRPWEVPAQAPNLFTNHTQEIRVPYTSSVQVMPAPVCQSLWTPTVLRSEIPDF